MCGCVQDADEDSGAVALEISNLGGVFLVMGVGSFFGIFVSLLEMVLGVKERSDENKVSVRTQQAYSRLPIRLAGLPPLHTLPQTCTPAPAC